MGRNQTCQAERKNGEPCQSPFVNSRGYCTAHDPETDPDEMSERARQGGIASGISRRNPGPGTLDLEDLPPLRDHAAAQEWLEVIGRAVASGEIDRKLGKDLSGIVRSWLDAYRGETADELLEELHAEIEELKRSPDWGPGAG